MDTAARYDGLAEWYDRELATGPLARVPRETALRLLGDGPGRLLDVGCGTGAHTAVFAQHGWTVTLFVEAKGVPALHPGYRRSGSYTDAPGVSPTGLRAKVGAAHLPLGLFVQSFLDAGFRLECFEEPGTREYPYAVALRCRR